MKFLVAVLAGLGLLAALVGVSSAKSGGSRFQSQTIVHNCSDTGSGGGMMGDDMDGDGDTITFSGPTELWPPNHKYHSVTITATDSDTSMAEMMMDPSGTTLMTAATSNQPTLGQGSGHTLDDASPAMGSASGDDSASQTIQLRSERDGVDPTKGGRTYTINASATFDGNSMETCHATFTVHVPHDMGH